MRIMVQVDGRKISADTGGQPLTSGSRGVEAQFDLSADYNGLGVTAAFVGGNEKRDVVLTASGRCPVPWEVMEEAGNMLLIGVVGKDGAGNIVIPTLWCKVKLIECGTVVSGIDPEDPTPDIAAQLLQIAQETVERAETAETGAESAKTAAETAQAGAEAAKQAIEDLGVTAHEDPNGPSVQKIVDEETGAITMDFGFKPADVKSVNGKTGEIELTLDDIPDGETYGRTTQAQVRQIGTNADDIDAIEAKIPPQASASNQLADKDFVNSSINSSAAFFRGSFATRAALFAVPWQTSDPAAANFVTNNDYAYVADDETHNDEAWRYIYVLQPGGTGNGWQPQFKVNDSPLTAAQLAALNSGATAENIASIADKYELPANGIPKTDLAAGVQQSLDKADTALQPAALEPYRTAAAQDVIDAAQDEKIAAAAQATESTTIGPAPIVTFDASAADMPLKGLVVNIEPKQTGEGDPSPENVRPISGWTGCNVTRTGKNLWKQFDSQTINGVTLTVDDDGGCSLTGTATANTTFAMPVTIPSGSYYLSANNSDVVGTTVRMMLVSSNGGTDKQIYLSAPNAAAPVTLDVEYTQLRIRVNTGASFSNAKFYPQLELGSVATDYEPYQGDIYDIVFPSEAGTVYGGTLDVTNKKLTMEWNCISLPSTGWEMATSGLYYNDNALPDSNHNDSNSRWKCNRYLVANAVPNSSAAQSRPDLSIMSVTGAYARRVFIKDTHYTTAADFIASLDTPIQLFYALAAPIVYDLSGVPEITTLLGKNNIWADCGDVTVIYGAYLETIKAHADRLGDSILSAIAPLETTYTASRAYAVGSYLFVGTKFYKVTAAIGSGDTINPGTNVTQTTVAAQLMELAGNL